MPDQLRCLGCLLFLVVSFTFNIATVSAQDTDEKSERKNPSREIALLKSEFTKKLSVLAKQFREAADDESKEEVIRNRREFEVTIIDKVIQLTRDRSESSRDIRDLVWYINRVKGDARNKVYSELTSLHLNSDRLSLLAQELGRDLSPTAQTEGWLRELIEKSSSEKVKGIATFALATYLQNVNDKAQSDSENEYLSNRTAEQLDTEIESLLTICQEKFADVSTDKSTLGELAKTRLLTSQIKVGKLAPDIQGKDLDDVEFKLSDYRGKVVVIDFWGDW